MPNPKIPSTKKNETPGVQYIKSKVQIRKNPRQGKMVRVVVLPALPPVLCEPCTRALQVASVGPKVVCCTSTNAFFVVRIGEGFPWQDFARSHFAMDC